MAVSTFFRFAGGSRAAAVAAGFAAALVAGGWLVQRGTRTGEPSVYETARLFEEVRRHISADFVDTVSDAQLYRKAVDGILYELNDPYTRFLPPDRFERLAESTSGNFAGIGLQVDIRDGWVVVMAPLPGSPAEHAGFEPGDRLLEIDGRTTQQLTLEEAVDALRGPVGSRIRLRVDRIGAAEPFAVVLRRARVHVNAVRRAEMLTPEVGYVELRAFTDSTAVELQRAVDGLRRRGMRSLVLDLRTNPGGLLEQGVRVADLFLDRGSLLLRTHGRTPQESHSYVDEAPQRWPGLPLTVVVDGLSASATEIVAGALQDHDRAAIIGTPTYGKGSAQTVFPLVTGGLKLTTTRWYTPAGRSIMRRSPRDTEFGVVDEPPRERPRFKTLGGRIVEGGGGIVPDIAAGDTLPDTPTTLLNAALAGKSEAFRGALSEVALTVKRNRLVTQQNFEITPELFGLLYARLEARGVRIPRVVYDDVSPAVSRLLSYEIARVVFGPAAEFRRRAASDNALRVAVSIASGARNPRDPLRRVAQIRGEAARADASG